MLEWRGGVSYAFLLLQHAHVQTHACTYPRTQSSFPCRWQTKPCYWNNLNSPYISLGWAVSQHSWHSRRTRLKWGKVKRWTWAPAIRVAWVSTPTLCFTKILFSVIMFPPLLELPDLFLTKSKQASKPTEISMREKVHCLVTYLMVSSMLLSLISSSVMLSQCDMFFTSIPWKKASKYTLIHSTFPACLHKTHAEQLPPATQTVRCILDINHELPSNVL